MSSFSSKSCQKEQQRRPSAGSSFRMAPVSMMMLCLCLALFSSSSNGFLVANAQTTEETEETNKYREYPLRTAEEAAVIEWGHSAIISALDVSVAHFGPQTSQAALFEVETMPVLADPVNGFMHSPEDESEMEIKALNNADAVRGNVVVMTNAGDLLTGVQMAQIAQLSGAAALLVVNVDEDHPDEIYRLEADDDFHEGDAAAAEEIDIPVVMLSYNSASVLTSATVTAETKAEDVINHGMPERIRLYAGGDRPFFEDVVTNDPAVYLIHNLMTAEECDALVQQASTKLSPLPTKDDSLQFLHDPSNYGTSQRVMLWQGLLQSPATKAVQERMEQATGFPADHFSDFVIDRIDKGTAWDLFHDRLDAAPAGLPMATMTLFLTEPAEAAYGTTGGELIYPQAVGGPVKVRPQKGLAVIHHNMNEKHEFEPKSLHGLLEYSGDEPLYIARKYVLSQPVSNARRIALPAFAVAFGGKLPSALSDLYEFLTDKFGHDTGGMYFDKLCVFVPLVIILGLVQLAVNGVRNQLTSSSSSSKKTPAAASNSPKSNKARSKRGKKTD